MQMTTYPNVYRVDSQQNWRSQLTGLIDISQTEFEQMIYLKSLEDVIAKRSNLVQLESLISLSNET
jgi:hypothetical protein